ncbi:MAG TPA: Isoniazid-inducible protein iniA, partial [Mycobacterium sp.]
VSTPALSPQEMGGDFGGLNSVAQLDAKPAGKGQKVVTGLRGSYGGVVMIGMLSSVAGLGLFNPLSVGAGLLLGRMAYKEDKENRLLRARAEAKTNVRRFVDDVSFVVGKESRDRLKIIHRTLRDHYRDIATELSRSLNESLQSTIAAAHIEEAERDNKVRELERQLNILNQVTDNVDKLTPQVTVGRV